MLPKTEPMENTFGHLKLLETIFLFSSTPVLLIICFWQLTKWQPGTHSILKLWAYCPKPIRFLIVYFFWNIYFSKQFFWKQQVIELSKTFCYQKQKVSETFDRFTNSRSGMAATLSVARIQFIHGTGDNSFLQKYPMLFIFHETFWACKTLSRFWDNLGEISL